MARTKTPWAARHVRHFRVRNKVHGDETRPRLNVFRSLHHTYAQVIDDARGHTLVAASSREVGGAHATKTDAAKQVGKMVAERAKAKGVESVTFDRGGYKYHGRVKALADAAREGGLEF